MSETAFIGKENMLENWNKVMISILRADNGVSNFEHIKDKDKNVVGLKVEVILKFNELLASDYIEKFEDAIEFAKKEIATLVVKKGIFTSKQRMLIDWLQIKNSILKAQSGEMKLNFDKNDFAGGGIFGMTIELALEFDGPLFENFDEEEISNIKNVLNKKDKK